MVLLKKKLLVKHFFLHISLLIGSNYLSYNVFRFNVVKEGVILLCLCWICALLTLCSISGFIGKSKPNTMVVRLTSWYNYSSKCMKFMWHFNFLYKLKLIIAYENWLCKFCTHQLFCVFLYIHVGPCWIICCHDKYVHTLNYIDNYERTKQEGFILVWNEHSNWIFCRGIQYISIC